MSVFFSYTIETLQGVDQIEKEGRRCARSVDVNQALRRRVFSQSENTSSQLLTLKHTLLLYIYNVF